MSNVKNYHEQGGDKWVVKGDLEFADGGRLLFNGQQLKPAEGLVDLDSSDTITAAEYNKLLEKLYEAGIMAADKTELVAAIAAAQEILDDAVVGEESGEYPQSDYDTFSTAIEAAQDVVDDSGATQSDVNAAVSTLESAVSTFEAAEIT